MTGKKIRSSKKDFFSKPKFSVLMANYNKGKYIAGAIQSVLGQTFRDWELVIVDDCSTDKSIETIGPFLKDKRIKLLKNKTNIGIMGTQERLVYESKSDIFGVLDSDDALLENALEMMYVAHKKNLDCGFIYSQYMVCDADLNDVKIGHCGSMARNGTNLRKSSASHFKTFKKKYFLKTDGYDEEILYASDMDVIFKMEEVTKFLFIDKVLYRYRLVPFLQSNDPVLQSNDPIRRQISFVSHVLAKYKAYKRRLNTNSPNLTRREMSVELFYAASLCIKQKKLGRARFFLLNAIKLDPINLRGLKVFVSGLF